MYVKNSMTEMKRYLDSVKSELEGCEVGSEKYNRIRNDYFKTIKSAERRRSLMFWKRNSKNFANIKRLTDLYTEKMFSL